MDMHLMKLRRRQNLDVQKDTILVLTYSCSAQCKISDFQLKLTMWDWIVGETFKRSQYMIH